MTISMGTVNLINPNKMNETILPKVAVDAALFAIDKNQLKVLLIKLKKGPYEKKWCLPGGLVGISESLDEAAKRALFQKANIVGVHLEQLYTFGDPKRDVRSRSISVAYFALVKDPKEFKIETTPYYSQICWWPINNLPKMAFDHKKIIQTAKKRLQVKIVYSNISYSLLPTEFTLSQLQKVYEIILEQKLDKRNFRKRIVSLDLVKKTGKKLGGEQHRPAQLYRFPQRGLEYFNKISGKRT